jgi:arsenate reductase (glutaredoxin)
MAKKKQKLTVFHKPNCSTCQQTMGLLKGSGCELDVVEYLETPPTESELKAVLKKLKIPAEALVRKKEKLYKEKYEGKKISEAQWIKIMTKNPILIERPIIIMGNKAVIGRPPEKVLELIG